MIYTVVGRNFWTTFILSGRVSPEIKNFIVKPLDSLLYLEFKVIRWIVRFKCYIDVQKMYANFASKYFTINCIHFYNFNSLTISAL